MNPRLQGAAYALAFAILACTFISSRRAANPANQPSPVVADVCECGNATQNAGTLLPNESAFFTYGCATQLSTECKPCKWTVSVDVTVNPSNCFSEVCFPDRVTNCTNQPVHIFTMANLEVPCATSKELIVWVKHNLIPPCNPNQADTWKSLTVTCQRCLP